MEIEPRPGPELFARGGRPCLSDVRRLLDSAVTPLPASRISLQISLYGFTNPTRNVTAVDPDVADHVELGDRTAQLGVDDLLERFQDLVARRLHANEPSAEKIVR
jgi:hypothetical protein